MQWGVELVRTATGGHLDQLVGGPVAVLAAVTASWLLGCVRTARRQPAHRAVRVVGGPGGHGRFHRAVRTGLAFLGAAGLLARADGASAAAPDAPCAAAPDGPSAPAPRARVPHTPVPHTLVPPTPGARLPVAQTEPVVTPGGVTDGGEKVPSLWPVGREHSREPVAPGPDDQVVVVRRGDSLWSLARQRLGPEVSRTAIYHAVHDWYDLNESVIGPDPDLILPGQVLHVPGARPRIDVADGA